MAELTRKLYDEDPYAKEFKAQIRSAERTKKGWKLVLDQTMFFPEEGGQDCDTGILEAVNAAYGTAECAEGKKAAVFCVTDVQIHDGVIIHTVIPERTDPSDMMASDQAAEDFFVPGQEVSGRINWTHRFSNMQNHTGEHILSGLIHKHFGYDNVGFHLSPNAVTLDQSGYLDPEKIAVIERKANEAVWADLEVSALYYAPEEAAKKTYRSKIPIEGPVRIVTVEGIDDCACCAPHVRRTGEIGLIKIVRSEKYKGGTRITFVCGDRAYEESKREQAQVEAVSHLLKAKKETAAEAVGRLYEENTALKERILRLQEEKIRTLTRQAACGQDDENDCILIFTKDLDPIPQRNLVNLLMEQYEKTAAVFVEDSSGYRFVIGSRTVDCRNVARSLKERFQARGGGSMQMIQGSVTASADALAEMFKEENHH